MTLFYYKDGSVLDYKDSSKTLHRENAPAVVHCYENGEIEQEEYFLEGLRHRVDGPAFSYYENGEVECEEYFLEGLRHRVDGPAFSYYENGKVACERYWLEGKRHRVDGPAWISYYMNGKVNYEEYWLEGEKYNKEDYYKTMEEVKSMDEALRLTDPREWVRKII